MDSMLNTIWLIITALAFGGVVEKAGVLERLITPIIEKAKSNGALVASLVSSIFATNIITADQYIAIVLPGRMFKTAFARRGLAPAVLSRTVAGSATPTSALIPWNSCGAYMAATLGVATWSYAPWAFFSYISPLLTVAIAYAGIRMLRAPESGPARAEGMTTEGVTETTVTPLPDRVILRVVCAYAAAFVAFGFIVDGPGTGAAGASSRSSRRATRC